jgi:C4-dicarboxylate-specific signal transduction histidine kinase
MMLSSRNTILMVALLAGSIISISGLVEQELIVANRLTASVSHRAGMAEVANSVLHINDIVNRQQSLSGRGGLIESFNIQDVIHDVLNIHALILKEAGVVVREHLGNNWGMLGDRSKLTQVVLNLVVNAQESIVMAQAEPRLIDITTSNNDDETVTLEIKDNGQGIDPENLKNMFTYGFTTKKTDHGFGLHASALAAIEMGGKLDVFSDGFGKGATFFLTLPKIHPDAV